MHVANNSYLEKNKTIMVGRLTSRDEIFRISE